MIWRKPLIDQSHPVFPWLILLNISLVTLLAIVSSLSSSLAASNIQGELMIDQTGLIWLSTGFLAAVGTCLPISGWLAERFGYKFAFFLGLSIFIVASICAALAPNFATLITFRVIEGCGGGIIFPISLTIIQRVFPKERMALALSIYMGIGFGMGSVAGFLFGGYVGQYLAWQWLYWINVFLGIPCLIVTWLFQPETEAHPEMPMFDHLGYFFFVSFLVCWLMIITNVKALWNTLGWSSTFIRSCLIVGAISLILMVRRELRAQNPAVMIRLFRSRHFWIGCIALAVNGALLFGTATGMPGLFEHILGYEKWRIALLFAGYGVVLGIVGSTVGFLTEWINVRILTLIGLVIMAISCFAQMTLTIQSDQWQWASLFMIRALGTGLALGPGTALALIDIPKEDIPPGSMLVTFCRQMGGASGASIISLIAVYRQAYHTQVYSANVLPYSTTFQSVTTTLQERFQDLGINAPTAETLSHLSVAQNLIHQSTLSATNDAYFAMGWVVVAIAVILSYIIIKTVWFEKKSLPT